MANFCLMAKEDEVSFSNIESNDELYSYEELQDAYDELCENTIKLHAKYTTLKKKEMRLCNEIVTLKDKNENLLKDINNLTSKIKSSITLEEENTKLKETIKDLTKTLAKFVNGKENLDMLLGRQRCVFNKEGLGYTPENKQKFYKNFFVKEFCSNSSFTTCKSCGRNGHIADVCPMKKTFYKKNYKGSNPKVVKNWNTHKAWVPKANPIGPKKMWVPKRIT
jgi:cell division protein FtsB